MIDDTAANMRAAEARAGRTRPRIRGTDPRLSPLVEQIGRGYRPNNEPDYGGVRRQFEEFRNRGYTAQGEEVHNRPFGEARGRDRMVADMQAEAAGRRPSDAAINDDFARRLGEAGKTRPRANPAEIRGRGQVSLAWDDDPKAYGWHYSPAENAEGIRTGGLDPQFKGRHGPMAEGVHFSNSPETYQPVGDRAWNVYRVRNENIPDPVQRSTDDFFTRSRIDPRNIEVYEGPGRFGRLGAHMSGANPYIGLYQSIAPLLGLPYLQTPADWVLNDVMAQNYGPGGAMDPYRDYEGPRDPQTGAILA